MMVPRHQSRRACRLSTRIVVLPAVRRPEESPGSRAGTTDVEIRMQGAAHLLGEAWRRVLSRGHLLPFREWSRLVAEDAGPGREAAAYLSVVEQWAGRVGPERVRLVVTAAEPAATAMDGTLVDAVVAEVLAEVAGRRLPRRRAARILADAFADADLSAVAGERAAAEARSWVERMAQGVTASGVPVVGDPLGLLLPHNGSDGRPVPLAAAVGCPVSVLGFSAEPPDVRARRADRVARLRRRVEAATSEPEQELSGREALEALSRRAAGRVRRSTGRVGPRSGGAR